MSESQKGRGALLAGGLAAILASTCCLGPLVLIALGFSGAWIGNLTVLEPYRPFFIGAALLALFFAYRRIFRPAQACKPVRLRNSAGANYLQAHFLARDGTSVLGRARFSLHPAIFLLIRQEFTMKKLFAALALACRCFPGVGRHPNRHAVRTGHDLRRLSDHGQESADFQGRWRQ
jgi:hypothetical protein